MTPRRIRLSRQKGHRLPADAINCTRRGKWGNPFKADGLTFLAVAMGFRGDLAGRTACAVELHRRWLGLEARDGPLDRSFLGALPENIHVMLHGDAIKCPPPLSHAEIRLALRGHDLACWCRLDAPHCHVDTLLEIANAPG